MTVYRNSNLLSKIHSSYLWTSDPVQTNNADFVRRLTIDLDVSHSMYFLEESIEDIQRLSTDRRTRSNQFGDGNSTIEDIDHEGTDDDIINRNESSTRKSRSLDTDDRLGTTVDRQSIVIEINSSHQVIRRRDVLLISSRPFSLTKIGSSDLSMSHLSSRSRLSVASRHSRGHHYSHWNRPRSSQQDHDFHRWEEIHIGEDWTILSLLFFEERQEQRRHRRREQVLERKTRRESSIFVSLIEVQRRRRARRRLIRPRHGFRRISMFFVQSVVWMLVQWHLRH